MAKFRLNPLRPFKDNLTLVHWLRVSVCCALYVLYFNMECDSLPHTPCGKIDEG